MQTGFGGVLKDWRNQRRMSQLDLGLSANVSARHISFLETGRARPSRSMVLNLCETLEVPRAARNTLLGAAGFSPAYRRRGLNEADMAHVRAAVDWTLERHDPFPALAMDKHWTLVRTNRSAGLLLGAAGLAEGDSLLEAATDGRRLAKVLDNWPEVALHTITRLRTESAHLGGDPVLDEAADALAREMEGALPDAGGVLPAVVPARYRADGMVLSLFSTLAQFGSAEDIALAELKIEMMFPADDATRTMLMALAEASG
jgi:transcriptional regulator with XRE-family HTH domain